MNGNPYSSEDIGMAPHMRDIKNKICQDCELVALLEDDSGMELLVANKIISLDLPVKDVYKMWLAGRWQDTVISCLVLSVMPLTSYYCAVELHRNVEKSHS